MLRVAAKNTLRQKVGVWDRKAARREYCTCFDREDDTSCAAPLSSFTQYNGIITSVTWLEGHRLQYTKTDGFGALFPLSPGILICRLQEVCFGAL